VQLYVKHLQSKVERPVKELRGFRRVAIQPGEARTVQLPLPANSLAYWDTSRKAFVVEPDTVEISVGGSSTDEKLKTRVAVH
jgi:beta-glucosidase